jgi:hypothetical protein
MLVGPMIWFCLFVCLNIVARSRLGKVSRSGAKSSHRGGEIDHHCTDTAACLANIQC